MTVVISRWLVLERTEYAFTETLPPNRPVYCFPTALRVQQKQLSAMPPRLGGMSISVLTFIQSLRLLGISEASVQTERERLM